ncbi:MAG: hypothetical protein UZ19_OD1000345 [Parcubacteria bacterium OLB19]|nr:MAG: hypothetical protein UZ19_OD1000345 [Parcubacteria bacterium OLB19]
MLRPITNTLELRDILKFLGIAISILLFGAYLSFQARYLIAGPQLILDYEPPVNNTTRVVELTGTATNITHLWLNDRPIFTDEKGHFKEALILENGYTITTLKARDRYGRETEIVRSFVYTPASIIQYN